MNKSKKCTCYKWIYMKHKVHMCYNFNCLLKLKAFSFWFLVPLCGSWQNFKRHVMCSICNSRAFCWKLTISMFNRLKFQPSQPMTLCRLNKASQPLRWRPRALSDSSTLRLSFCLMKPLSTWSAMTWSGCRARCSSAAQTVESTPPLSSIWHSHNVSL